MHHAGPLSARSTGVSAVRGTPTLRRATAASLLALCLGTLLLAIALPAHADVPASVLGPKFQENGVPTLAPLVNQVTPAVVNIAVVSKEPAQQNPLFRDPFFRHFFNLPENPPEQEERAAGSGVIVDASKGYILTNNHVIAHAVQITVTLKDHRTFQAKLVGTDPATDIALLKIDAHHLRALQFGNSDQLHVGDFVVAIGNPFALGQTVTSGIVSALGRSGLNIEGYEDFIQTDASINPGNSGGALVNLKGQLVGINTAIIGPSGGNVGIGFAVPSNMAHAVMEQLLKYGKVNRGQIGVMIQDLTPDLAKALDIQQTEGAVVTQVLKGSPAASAGIKAGDVITALDGDKVTGATDLRNRVGVMTVGTKVTLTILRDGKTIDVPVTIGKPQETSVSGGESAPQLEGATFEDIQPGDPEYGKVEGARVTEVQQDSPAWQNGLRKGDVIIGVNRARVRSVAELKQALEQAKGSVIALNIIRNGGRLFIVIR